MINMLTPSKRRALRDGPRKIKVSKFTSYLFSSAQHDLNKSGFCFCFLQPQYNVTLTSQTNPDQVLNQILSILPEKNVDFTQKG